jgi:hypothetical protein
VAHYSRLSKVVIDVPSADHDRELAFWSAAVGQPLTRFERHPEYHGAGLHGQDFSLLIQQWKRFVHAFTIRFRGNGRVCRRAFS